MEAWAREYSLPNQGMGVRQLSRNVKIMVRHLFDKVNLKVGYM